MHVNSLRPSDAYMRQWSNHHWFSSWLVASSAPSHYQNQCWNIVNKTLKNKLQWNFNRNSNNFIQENAFESVVCEKTAILSRPQCVKRTKPNALEGSMECHAILDFQLPYRRVSFDKWWFYWEEAAKNSRDSWNQLLWYSLSQCYCATWMAWCNNHNSQKLSV